MNEHTPEPFDDWWDEHSYLTLDQAGALFSEYSVLRERVEMAEAGLDNLEGRVRLNEIAATTARAAMLKAEAERDAARAEVARMREALQFYATSAKRNIIRCTPMMTIEEDGSIARAALEGAKETT